MLPPAQLLIDQAKPAMIEVVSTTDYKHLPNKHCLPSEESGIYGSIITERPEISRAKAEILDLIYDLADLNSGESECSQIANATLYSSRTLLSSLPLGFPLPQVSPDGEGGLMFIWRNCPSSMIVILSGRTMHYVTDAGTDEAKYYNDRIFANSLPPELINGIQ